MDINETLRLLRLTIKQMRVDTDPDVRRAHAAEIAEYFEAIDEWLSKGGFLPNEWRKTPRGVVLDAEFIRAEIVEAADDYSDEEVEAVKASTDRELNIAVEEAAEGRFWEEAWDLRRRAIHALANDRSQED